MSDIAARIHIVQGDITRVEADAIVNAANSTLLGGGGVDGAIHRAAGPELLAECRTLGGCPTGEARITGGYRLPARYVIHAVGPVWRGGDYGEDDLLAAAYANSLALATEYAVETVAFPAISTGVYGFPLTRATRIALTTMAAHLARHDLPARVLAVCFSADDRAVYEKIYAEYFGESNHAEE